jgi:3-methyl-2-oxobutanoate hydroxymethyltransferase
MGHLGMTPQSVHQYGGYKVQGKRSDHALALLNDAKALEAAGAFAIVLEAIPAELAETITEQLSIPTIGIGAGPHCDGQILVLYDLLGLFDDFVPKFVKPYAHLKADALQALRRYKEEVEQGKFPNDHESYH